MPSAPWFKFYPSDYLSSPFVQALDPEQELWYLRLLIASAIAVPRGCLPLANGKLWRLAKAPSLEHFEKHAGPILAKFEKDEAGGLYRIPKIANQMTSIPDLSANRSEAGKRGAAKRWQNDGKLPSTRVASATAEPRQKIADSDVRFREKKKIPLRELRLRVSAIHPAQTAKRITSPPKATSTRSTLARRSRILGTLKFEN